MKTYTENIKIWRDFSLLKKELKNNLTLFEKSFENILWVKSANGYLYTEKDVYLAGVYNSPKHSNHTKEYIFNVIDLLREQLSKFSSSDIYYRRRF